jgi:ectoine hydroxylase
MLLDVGELERFASDGVLLHRLRLSDQHVGLLLDHLPALARCTDTTAFEADARTPRALHGGYEQHTLLDRLTRLDVLLDPAQQILQDRVYVYQFKVNLKAAFVGDFWPWHQDFSFWSKEDEMPEPRAITVGIFLDEVTEFNGPMYFIPGSHRSGCHDVDEAECAAGPGEWHRHVAASLSHQSDPRKVTALAARHGILAPKGERGTVLFFDCNVVHASPGNISPLERRILFITYNSVTNIPRNARRPGFLVNRNVSALNALDSASLVSVVTSQ